MANTFVVIKQTISLLNTEKRFCREVARSELIQEKADALEEIFGFAREYVASANHQLFSTVGDRLYYYLTEGDLNYQKVADRFGASVEVVAGNVHYASRKIESLVGDQINRIKYAGDIEAVREALMEFYDIRKSVVNPLDLPNVSEELLKSLSKRKKYKAGGVEVAKNLSPIIIP
ncbi:hypothetical protein [Paenibacillus sp. 32352]|uniref:hypothetical protein n=1 Tax=Paenibacillus sp. 32352 TaxID=1969111 RepID=UPI0009AEE2A5|nr:hypothetical protein [Paenibacillus sp. 32352]